MALVATESICAKPAFMYADKTSLQFFITSLEYHRTYQQLIHYVVNKSNKTTHVMASAKRHL